jgi:hypothetical protein
MRAFWDMAPCSLVAGDWRLRGSYCLHHQSTLRLYGAVSQKALIFILAAMRTWTLMLFACSFYGNLSLNFRNVKTVTMRNVISKEGFSHKPADVLRIKSYYTVAKCMLLQRAWQQIIRFTVLNLLYWLPVTAIGWYRTKRPLLWDHFLIYCSS